MWNILCMTPIAMISIDEVEAKDGKTGLMEKPSGGNMITCLIC